MGRQGYSVIDPRDCYVGGQSTNCHVNHVLGLALTADAELSLWFHPAAEPKLIESRLIRLLDPPWNTQGR